MVHGPIDEHYTVFGAGLGEDIAHMVIHGALADRKHLGNFLVGQAAGQVLDDFDLPFREADTKVPRKRHWVPII